MKSRPFSWLFGLLAVARCAAAADPLRFEAQTVDPRVGEICYAVTLADVDGDGKKDIVAVTENRVVWYHNSDWKLRVIIADQTERDNVCIAAHDIDGDGQIDFALGAGWLNNRHLGSLYWLSRGPSLDQPWKVHPLGQESWTHRIRFGDILGSGSPQLVVSPLNKTRGEGVRLLAFHVPEDLSVGAPWKFEVLDGSLNAMHAHWTGDLDGDSRDDLLTASMEGVYLFSRNTEGHLIGRRIGLGVEGEQEMAQKTGAGEVKVGRLKGGRRFIATVEPMHGNQAVIYLQPVPGEASPVPDDEKHAGLWERVVLDETLGRGHGLWPADIDQDGSDELVLGHSDRGTGMPAGPGVYVYRAEGDPRKWRKLVVDDGGIAAEDLVAEDLTGDGWPEIVAGGRATHNVKLYLNRGEKVVDYLQLAGKTVLVLGVANRKSVAWHVARVLTEAGAQVLYSVRSLARKQQVEKLAPGACVYVCDVERPEEIERLRDEIAANHAQLHGVVHSIAFADYSAGFLPFHETPRRAFLQAVDVSCFSLIAVSNAFRGLLDKAQGSVVTISISTTRMAAENYGYMAPIKAALDSAVCFLAKSFSQFSRIRFNAVCPGLLKSSASAGIPGYIDSYLYAEQATLRKEAVQTEEVAHAVAFLLSPRSSGINAQGLVIDAGMGVNYFDQALVRADRTKSSGDPS